MRIERKRDEVRGRGHWLASIMFQGTGPKKIKFPHAPVSGESRNNNTGDLRGSEILEKIKNG
jgi:hypothetical protein